jgi:RNA polymerase-binding transcription factor DksA
MNVKRLSPKEIEELRRTLIDRKRQLADRVVRLSEESAQSNPLEIGETSSLPTHLADLGTQTFEQDNTLGLAERSAAEVQAIDQALARMESGTYGICEQCQQQILPDRLRALPSATRCTACQAAEEAA